ncbi:MAG: glutamine-hydrolyzing carbamoyl-phosphate synthase small subunit [Bdellovibrionales bacterium]
MKGFIVLESGEVFAGRWLGGTPMAGEVVFNTSHSGYEEIATDPSYFKQIMVMSTSQLGNYSNDDEVWESSKIHINGFVGLEIQNSRRESGWLNRLIDAKVPVIDSLDTRTLIKTLRNMGTVWGAALSAKNEDDAKNLALPLIREYRDKDLDWARATSCTSPYEVKGSVEAGPVVAVMDFGCKKNIIRELQKRTSLIKVFPSNTTSAEIKKFNPQGILLSNGPGNPQDVKGAVETIKELIGWRTIFGICMGHQLLCMALGGETYKLKFGHRGSNHPIRDSILNSIYITSQNHGYAVRSGSLPEDVEESHFNLNDGTLAGINCVARKCFSVQFHPESHPGPREAEELFDHFIKRVL